jgi:hypothetical protein
MESILNQSVYKDILIFGFDTGDIHHEFNVGNLNIFPDFDLRNYLQGYDEDDIDFIIDNDVKFAKFSLDTNLQFISPFVDDVCLIPFRLLKSGWISAMSIMPISNTQGIEIKSELNCTKYLFGQIWADSTFEINERDIPGIQSKYLQLLRLPKGYLDLSLRRFSRCYKYFQHGEFAGASELDDYWVDLVIALESVTSKNHEAIKSSMARRVSYLLANNPEERTNISTRVKDIYEQRCSIVHGDEKDEITVANHEKRFVEAESLRSLIRDTINACINLLIDPATSLTRTTGERKLLPNIIDEKYPVLRGV